MDIDLGRAGRSERSGQFVVAGERGDLEPRSNTRSPVVLKDVGNETGVLGSQPDHSVDEVEVGACPINGRDHCIVGERRELDTVHQFETANAEALAGVGQASQQRVIDHQRRRWTEREQATAGAKGRRCCNESVVPHGIHGRIELDLGEARPREPFPNGGREIGLAAMAGPQHGGGRCAHGRGQADSAGNVLVRDVAEDAAQHQHIGGPEAIGNVGRSGIGGDDLNVVEAGRRGGRPGLISEVGVELDKTGADIAPAGMIGQHADDVAALSRAQAQHGDRTGRGGVEGRDQQALHGGQALAVSRCRVVVVGVPDVPVELLPVPKDVFLSQEA